MSLNESTQKLDTQLEVSVKKFEKVAQDTGTKSFMYNEGDRDSKFMKS